MSPRSGLAAAFRRARAAGVLNPNPLCVRARDRRRAAGKEAIKVLSALYGLHAKGETTMGINIENGEPIDQAGAARWFDMPLHRGVGGSSSGGARGGWSHQRMCRGLGRDM